MAEFISCPYLGDDAELSAERENHIAERHPELLPENKRCIVETLANPDRVRRSDRFGNARLFYNWFDGLRGGKYVVVVVMRFRRTITSLDHHRISDG